MLAIVHNVVTMRHRTVSRRPTEVPLDEGLEPAAPDAAVDLEPVLDALAQLPLNQRAAIVMREVEGRSYAEIASCSASPSRRSRRYLPRAAEPADEARGLRRAQPRAAARIARRRRPACGGAAAVVGSDAVLKIAAVVVAGVVVGGAALHENGRASAAATGAPGPPSTAPSPVVPTRTAGFPRVAAASRPAAPTAHRAKPPPPAAQPGRRVFAARRGRVRRRLDRPGRAPVAVPMTPAARAAARPASRACAAAGRRRRRGHRPHLRPRRRRRRSPGRRPRPRCRSAARGAGAAAVDAPHVPPLDAPHLPALPAMPVTVPADPRRSLRSRPFRSGAQVLGRRRSLLGRDTAQPPGAHGGSGFERLYRRHAADVYRYALAVLRNPDDAEDVTQTTFLNAYRAFQRGERPKAPKNWLIAIAHNVCRQRFRQRRAGRRGRVRRGRLAGRGPDGRRRRAPATSAARSGTSRSTSGPRSSCASSRAAPTPRSRAILDLSVSAVETLIFRARRALREQLEEALTCDEAEFAISRQLDGRLPRGREGPPPRAPARVRGLRAPSPAAARAALGPARARRDPAALLARLVLRRRRRRGVAGAAGAGVAAKVLLVGTTAIVVAGVGYEGVHHKVWHRLVPHGHLAQAAKPPARGPVLAAGSIGPETTRLISDLRPPNRAPAHRPLAAPGGACRERPPSALLGAGPRRVRSRAAEPRDAGPEAAREVQRRGRPEAGCEAARAPRSSPRPASAASAASPSPPTQPVGAPVVAETPQAPTPGRRAPPPAPRGRRPAGRDDDDPPAAPVAAPPAKAPCKGKRHHAHRDARGEAPPRAAASAAVVARERHRPEARHEHRDRAAAVPVTGDVIEGTHEHRQSQERRPRLVRVEAREARRQGQGEEGHAATGGTAAKAGAAAGGFAALTGVLFFWRRKPHHHRG